MVNFIFIQIFPNGDGFNPMRPYHKIYKYTVPNSIPPMTSYKERIQKFSHQSKTGHARYQKWSYIRLLVFVLLVTGIILGFQWSLLGGFIGLLLAIFGFGRLVRWHESIKNQADFLEILVKINQQEVDALSHRIDWNAEGNQYKNTNHPYAADLDLFGKGSLFQYLNRCQTSLGQDNLADWFLHKADLETIRSRQAAIKELSPAIDFRQKMTGIAFLMQDDPKHLEWLQVWLQSPSFFITHPGYRWLLILAPLVTLLGIGLCILFWTWKAAWIPLLIPIYILWKTKEPVDEIHRLTERSANILHIYANLFTHLETQSWSSSWLQSLHRPIHDHATQPSHLLSRLSYAVSQLNVRNNFFAIFLNLIALWDLFWVSRLEKLKRYIQPHIQYWFELLSTMEALSSLATLSYNHPEWTFPEVGKQNIFKARQMGHPLIPENKRVSNDFEIDQDAQIKLITGSNMAGKSTFLRTVGINMVLALCGSVVCAREFSCLEKSVFTSMRTVDDLDQNVSSFYAELSRIKLILEAIKDKKDIFFLMDEILKGTNSRDRHAGSEALIHQLIAHAGTGLIATHDLALTRLEKETQGNIENWYFDVVVIGDQLEFDYKIKRGICQSFNATALMKKMGINMD